MKLIQQEYCSGRRVYIRCACDKEDKHIIFDFPNIEDLAERICNSGHCSELTARNGYRVFVVVKSVIRRIRYLTFYGFKVLFLSNIAQRQLLSHNDNVMGIVHSANHHLIDRIFVIFQCVKFIACQHDIPIRNRKR
jgi:hypothetical protein